MANTHDSNLYYVPHGSRWPVFASVALGSMFYAYAILFVTHTLSAVAAFGVIFITDFLFAHHLALSLVGGPPPAMSAPSERML